MLAHVAPGPHHLLGPLGIDVGRNSGVAFSLFSGHSALAVVLTLALTVVVAVCAARVAAVVGRAWSSGCCWAGGSATTSTASRGAASGGVVDFLTLPHWPAFNLADVAITLRGRSGSSPSSCCAVRSSHAWHDR